jgi:hypothetical protein
MPQIRKQIPGFEDFMDFETALIAYEFEGDPSRLIDYLRSDRPLDREKRDSFAWCLEHLSEPKRGGRPCNYELLDIAELAMNFYRKWKERNKEEGINDRGVSENMKYQSCVYLIELNRDGWTDSMPPDPDAVMQLIARPKSRREV